MKRKTERFLTHSTNSSPATQGSNVTAKLSDLPNLIVESQNHYSCSRYIFPSYQEQQRLYVSLSAVRRQLRVVFCVDDLKAWQSVSFSHIVACGYYFEAESEVKGKERSQSSKRVWLLAIGIRLEETGFSYAIERYFDIFSREVFLSFARIFSSLFLPFCD